MNIEKFLNHLIFDFRIRLKLRNVEFSNYVRENANKVINFISLERVSRIVAINSS